MKVLLDARAIAAPLHGIARYGWNLLRAYAAMETGHHFHVIFGPGPLPGSFEAPSNFTITRVPVAPYGIAEQLRMPRYLARVDCDLHHALTYTAPLASRRPLVLSVFDLIHLRYPREYSALHPLYYRLVVGPLARRARVVITLSEASRRDIALRLGADPARVRVTPLAADPAFRPPSPDDMARLEAAFGLAPGYVLHLSNYRSHKRAESVVEAYALLRARGDVKAPLVLAGNPPARFRNWLARDGRGTGVRVLGDIGEGDLPRLYGAAAVFVFPSLCEGFGLPPLEAMACGTPVIVSNVSSLPEVVGGDALLVDPADTRGIADAIALVLSDAALAADLRERGAARAATFSWDRVARETLALYDEALAR
ncbi:MAG: glycosyltransferase family 4 protein [Myxococcota bacterium]